MQDEEHVTTSDSTSVFVASHDEALVASITDSLNESGFQVSNAADNNPAYGGADAPEPRRLIVLDAAMPARARAELLGTLEAAPKTTRPPIVALSSRDSLRETASLDGVWVCLVKPVHLDDLVCAVDRISRHLAA
ncbi:MAG: response regulator transcription factor [Chloroflexi bacterium]|nr:response regulator transcription factor [Chloroflexota bacterium]